jgi:hypothetical protein
MKNRIVPDLLKTKLNVAKESKVYIGKKAFRKYNRLLHSRVCIERLAVSHVRSYVADTSKDGDIPTCGFVNRDMDTGTALRFLYPAYVGQVLRWFGVDGEAVRAALRMSDGLYWDESGYLSSRGVYSHRVEYQKSLLGYDRQRYYCALSHGCEVREGDVSCLIHPYFRGITVEMPGLNFLYDSDSLLLVDKFSVDGHIPTGRWRAIIEHLVYLGLWYVPSRRRFEHVLRRLSYTPEGQFVGESSLPTTDLGFNDVCVPEVEVHEVRVLGEPTCSVFHSSRVFNDNQMVVWYKPFADSPTIVCPVDWIAQSLYCDFYWALCSPLPALFPIAVAPQCVNRCIVADCSEGYRTYVSSLVSSALPFGVVHNAAEASLEIHENSDVILACPGFFLPIELRSSDCCQCKVGVSTIGIYDSELRFDAIDSGLGKVGLSEYAAEVMYLFNKSSRYYSSSRELYRLTRNVPIMFRTCPSVGRLLPQDFSPECFDMYYSTPEEIREAELSFGAQEEELVERPALFEFDFSDIRPGLPRDDIPDLSCLDDADSASDVDINYDLFG